MAATAWTEPVVCVGSLPEEGVGNVKKIWLMNHPENLVVDTHEGKIYSLSVGRDLYIGAFVVGEPRSGPGMLPVNRLKELGLVGLYRVEN
jgi:hypothetical protein